MKQLHWILLTLTLGWSGIRLAAVDLVSTGTEWRFFRGVTEASTPNRAAWRGVGFSDTSWETGRATFWYGDFSEGTALSDMQNNYSTLFLRKRFTVANPADLATLIVRARCDDGFIAWLNGQEIVRFNVPEGDLTFDRFATSPVNPDPAVFDDYPVTDPRSKLLAGDNVLAVQVFNTTLGSSDLIWDAALIGSVDLQDPTVVSVIPPNGAVVRDLFSVEISFSEPVQGMGAADLQINGVGATALIEVTPGQFVFSFPSFPAGPVSVAFRPDHGITDRASTPRPFAGGAWNLTVDPTARPPGLIISEFMTDNDGVIRDEEGDESDWIELHNASPQSVSLFGWSLTDDANQLGKWKFPALTLPAGGYLVVFASDKNRTSTTGRLHTNFRLGNDGEFLALVTPSGQIESGFAPKYPPQRENVSYGRANGAPTLLGYFSRATPGSANSTSGSGFAPGIRFSRPVGTYRTNFELVLTLEEPAENAVIRVTLDGSLPSETSPVHSAPIPVTSSLQVRARAFQPGLLPGKPVTGMFLKLEGTVPTFTSDLPVLIFHNFGRGRPPASGQQPAYLQVFEPISGVTSLTNEPTLTSRVGIGARGSSTLGYPKVSMNLELRDEFEADDDRELLGLPSDSDWVLYAPNNFEPVLIHNPLAHQLSRDLGRYSSRTRFVEVYLISDTVNGTVRTSTYQGIYVLEERVTRSRDRVDIAKLEPEHTRAPEVTGGYILKVDRPGPGENGLVAANQGLVYVDPPEVEITLPERSGQRQYLQSYLNSFGNALYGANWTHPETGYRRFIDVDSWIDHHLLNVLTFNVDALRLSTYFHKPRGGKLTFGPLWDFDRALNSTDGRDANPRIWSSSGGTDFFNESTQAWWGRLFTDPEFFQRWIDRYQELRRAQFATTNLWRLTDQQAGIVRRAQPREFTKWGVPLRGGTYQAEVNLLKTWLSNRVEFMDRQFVRPPTVFGPAGRFDTSVSVSLSVPTAGFTYYTLDGSDPRLPSGTLSPQARQYDGTPLTLTANTRVVARVQNPNHTALTGALNPPLKSIWSGPAAVTFFNVVPPLLVTEIMFHPAAPDSTSSFRDEDFEYLELLNTGTTPLELPGFTLSGGIQFVFPATGLVRLDPGQRALVVRNRTAFLTRYSTLGTSIAGEFIGQLANGGNRLVLTGPLGEPISNFTYAPDWAPLADGFGFALVLRDEASTPRDQLGDPSRWRLSTQVGGSPATVDPTPPVLPSLLVNEALTHTDLPLLDAVELHNPTGTTAVLDGWWLSDDYRTPKKYRFPTPSPIAAGGFLVIDESQFRPDGGGNVGFSLSSLGDEIHLFSADATGELTGYHSGFEFGGAFNGVSFGRLVSSEGREQFVSQPNRSLGAPNVGPLIGPLVLTELHVEPLPQGLVNNTEDEFIEVRNVTQRAVPWADPNHATNRWRIRGAVSFDFPANETIPPGGYVLVVSFDPVLNPQQLAAFRTRFNPPAIVPILGPWTGSLNNAGESVRLEQPDEPVPTPASNAGEVPYVLGDRIRYSRVSPWPGDAAGTGLSLQRRRSLQFGNDPVNWSASVPTAGRQNSPKDTLEPALDTDGDGLPDAWELAGGLNPNSAVGDDGALGDPDDDGLNNSAELTAGTEPRNAASRLSLEVFIPEIGTDVTLRLQAVSDRSYLIWARNRLEADDWELLRAIPAPTSDVTVEITDPASASPRFYRVSIP